MFKERSITLSQAESIKVFQTSYLTNYLLTSKSFHMNKTTIDVNCHFRLILMIFLNGIFDFM